MTPRPHSRPSRTIHRPPLPDRPITTAEAEEIGWTEAAQRHAISRGAFTRGGRGVILPIPPRDDVTDRQRQQLSMLARARASALRCPRAVVSHSAAAIALGMPTIGALQRPCLTVQ